MRPAPPLDRLPCALRPRHLHHLVGGGEVGIGALSGGAIAGVDNGVALGQKPAGDAYLPAVDAAAQHLVLQLARRQGEGGEPVALRQVAAHGVAQRRVVGDEVVRGAELGAGLVEGLSRDVLRTCH